MAQMAAISQHPDIIGRLIVCQVTQSFLPPFMNKVRRTLGTLVGRKRLFLSVGVLQEPHGALELQGDAAVVRRAVT
jgi:hypothetical protein